jgi:hypothetical protein
MITIYEILLIKTLNSVKIYKKTIRKHHENDTTK